MRNPLEELSDAEDFFHYYQVPFNSKIVNVVRVPVLKQFRYYLKQENLVNCNPSDIDIWQKQRELLLKAYKDFVHTSPLMPDSDSLLDREGRPFNHSVHDCATCKTGCN